MERKLFPDGFYYRDFGGELRKERWTETLAHERIDNIFERLEKLEGNRPDLWERIAELDSKIGELQAQWDSHFDDTPEPHTCGECVNPFWRGDYGLCRSHPVVKKGCPPISIWREHEAYENFKGEA